jgi:hypothetical protein
MDVRVASALDSSGIEPFNSFQSVAQSGQAPIPISAESSTLRDVEIGDAAVSNEDNAITPLVTDLRSASLESNMVPPLGIKTASNFAAKDDAELSRPSASLRTGLYYDPDMMLHSHIKEEHPECPDRIKEIMKRLEKAGLIHRVDKWASTDRHPADVLERKKVRQASHEEICLVHSERHYQEMSQTQCLLPPLF